MLRRNLAQASPWRSRPICLFCAARSQAQPFQPRSFSATEPLNGRKRRPKPPQQDGEEPGLVRKALSDKPLQIRRLVDQKSEDMVPRDASPKKSTSTPKTKISTPAPKTKDSTPTPKTKGKQKDHKEDASVSQSLKEALLGSEELKDGEALLGSEGLPTDAATKKQMKKREEQLQIQILDPDELKFESVEVGKPPVPMLSHGLDRVLFNPGVYLLQDPRSRIYNFDPYLEKIMPVNEFDFDALSEYKTSSKDQDLLDLTNRLGTKFTGSTSSMSGILQHFHFLLSHHRGLNHGMLSRDFPDPSKRFSKITCGPNAVFLRYKDGVYAIDDDKTFDKPNVMSWLGHSLEKLLTTERSEFEMYRRSSLEKAPAEDNASRCYHYSKQGNILMRSQLDAQDPRLPGTGVFDLKTRAVVSIRMNHKEYEAGSGYQLRYAQGEWESFEREFYDMTRATMLKYSLQVRMGRMDGIFIAFHNIERIFGFQYLPLGEMDRVLHGQDDTSLGDKEFKLSIGLLDELLGKATKQFPETTLRLHVEMRDAKIPFMYVFAEPVTEEQADEIQEAGATAQKEFARTVVGIGKDNPEVQAAWQDVQNGVDEQVDHDGGDKLAAEKEEEQVEVADSGTEEVASDVNGSQDTATAAQEEAPTTEQAPDGPLMGWTLTIRNKINGGYVDRPVKIKKEDEWAVEYHIQEIPETSRWRLYNALKERRQKLIGDEEQEVDKGLQTYRALIQRFTKRGRRWREEQDKMTEEMGVQVYKPLGPGSETEAPTKADHQKELPKEEVTLSAVETVVSDNQTPAEDEAVKETGSEKKSWFGI